MVVDVLLYSLVSWLCLSALGVGEVLRLETADFQDTITSQQSGPYFVMFFAPWCKHCRHLDPIWEELAGQKLESVSLAKIDCTQDTQVCADNGVKEYPTLKLYSGSDVYEYQGSRDVGSFVDFLSAPEEVSETNSVMVDKNGLASLTDANFQPYLDSTPGVHFVEFYAPWCSHCKELAPTWDALVAHFQALSLVHISVVDCTREVVTCRDMEVTGYPTLLFFSDNITWKKHSGNRDLDALVKFVEDYSPRDVFGVIHLSEDNFEAVVSDGLVFILYYTSWCSRCKQVLSIWDDFNRAAKFSVTLAKVDCSVSKQLCDAEGAEGVPSMMLYRNGNRLKEYYGKESVQDLTQFIQDNKT